MAVYLRGRDRGNSERDYQIIKATLFDGTEEPEAKKPPEPIDIVSDGSPSPRKKASGVSCGSRELSRAQDTGTITR